jgi:hypothetical protein
METEKQVNATFTNEELKDIDAQKGKKVDKGEIVHLISQLPPKERIDLIRDLQNASAYDADQFSTGREAGTDKYDRLRDDYQKKAKDAEKKQEQPAETK